MRAYQRVHVYVCVRALVYACGARMHADMQVHACTQVRTRMPTGLRVSVCACMHTIACVCVRVYSWRRRCWVRHSQAWNALPNAWCCIRRIVFLTTYLGARRMRVHVRVRVCQPACMRSHARMCVQLATMLLEPPEPGLQGGTQAAVLHPQDNLSHKVPVHGSCPRVRVSVPAWGACQPAPRGCLQVATVALQMVQPSLERSTQCLSHPA